MSPTWVIDSLEEDSAQIEEDGVRVIHVPRSILPPSVAERNVLMVALEQQRRGKREAVRVTITLDAESTEERSRGRGSRSSGSRSCRGREIRVGA